jgi:plastocyanin
MRFLGTCFVWLVTGAIFVGCGGGEQASPGSGDAAETPAEKVVVSEKRQVDPATTGSVSGKINYAGKAGRKSRIRMNADPNCAKQHQSPIYATDLKINDNDTLHNAFVWVSSGLEGYAFDTPSEAVELHQKGCVYEPHVLGIQTGQNLNVLNHDGTTHNINPSPAQNRDWNISQAPNSAPIVKKFARAEIMIPVKCNVHPWMKSYIGVVPHPYFTITGADGSFELKGLPPGEYTVESWHEKLGVQKQTVTVSSGEAQTADFSYGS